MVAGLHNSDFGGSIAGFCRVTHADPRCEASALAVAHTVAGLLGGASAAAVDGVIAAAVGHASARLTTVSRLLSTALNYSVLIKVELYALQIMLGGLSVSVWQRVSKGWKSPCGNGSPRTGSVAL
jgi:ADP-ribosylglycohydrolase